MAPMKKHGWAKSLHASVWIFQGSRAAVFHRRYLFFSDWTHPYSGGPVSEKQILTGRYIPCASSSKAPIKKLLFRICKQLTVTEIARCRLSRKLKPSRHSLYRARAMLKKLPGSAGKCQRKESLICMLGEKSLNKITDSNTVSTEEWLRFWSILISVISVWSDDWRRNWNTDQLARTIWQNRFCGTVQPRRMFRRQRLYATTSRKMQLYYGLRTATGMIAALFFFVIQQADLSTFPEFLFRNPAIAIRTEVSAHPETSFYGCHRIFLQSFTQLW